MIIVDTGVWIDHLKCPEAHLAVLGERLEALVHPYVLGEIALGSLPHRARLLQRMGGMPQPPILPAAVWINPPKSVPDAPADNREPTDTAMPDASITPSPQAILH